MRPGIDAEGRGGTPDGGSALHSLARVSLAVGAEPDPSRALSMLVMALCTELGVDRAGIFRFDNRAGSMRRLVGIDQAGAAEYEGEVVHTECGRGPLSAVARGELPYVFTDDASREYPEAGLVPGVRALAVIPLRAGDTLIGALCVDNCRTGQPLPEAHLPALFLFAAVAALPLFALYEQQERVREAAMRHDISSEVLAAVTGGKVRLCTADELAAEWPADGERVALDHESTVRRVRDAARQAARGAGMDDDRTYDFVLCVSEAATNAVVHGGGGWAVVAEHDGRLRARVTDHGGGIDARLLPRATLQKGWSGGASLGLGFSIMHETADRLFLHTGPAGTTVIVEMGVEAKVALPAGCNPLLWGEIPAL